jgi:hypothetical protein
VVSATYPQIAWAKKSPNSFKTLSEQPRKRYRQVAFDAPALGWFAAEKKRGQAEVNGKFLFFEAPEFLQFLPGKLFFALLAVEHRQLVMDLIQRRVEFQRLSKVLNGIF